MAVATTEADRAPRDAASATPRRLAPAQGADDRRRRQDPEPGVRRHLDLEDPLPRGPEAARAAAHAGRLPALQPRRRRSPARDPADAAGRVPAAAGDPPGACHRRFRAEPGRRRRRPARRAMSVDCQVTQLSAEELVEQAGVSRDLPQRAPGLRHPPAAAPQRQLTYDETDLEIVRAAAELSRFGVAGRNLRVFRTSADREAALLEQVLGASLRSRSQARRQEAVENLESLAAICGHLKHLMLVRDLRRLKGDVRLPPADAEGHSLARDRSATRTRSGSWSPTPTTCRAGGRASRGSRTCEGERRAARVDRRPRDRARDPGPRRLPRRGAGPTARRFVWEQEIAGTPFERILNEARVEVGIEPEGGGRDRGDDRAARSRCAASRASARR